MPKMEKWYKMLGFSIYKTVWCCDT